ncbi:hypothetical protein F9B74_04100 [Pelistega sp. NLN82]|uniref:Uncharacterized protein n=1 Tax=Pelistega ratti TaxID=2652177 RepID=A0A6L9Y560_9BURK|nr:hypothetical protein [Pelistega ratti]NEN75509.1 hypothetical protein [Pelistega ratti]
MSWRLLFFTLLVLAGAATVGGLSAGEWLVEHAPKQANLPNVSKDDPPPPVDEKGLPIMRQPAQPLMSGLMGIPTNEVKVDWAIKADNITSAKTASVETTVPTTTSTVTVSNSVNQSIKTRPIGQARQETTTATTQNWEGAFRQELAQCRQLGFFERASCVGRVREQYCGPNKAWGRVNDCPARR